MTQDLLLQNLRHLLPQVSFEAGQQFSWSPATSTITYLSSRNRNNPNSNNLWALLHEASHALLGHMNYQRDIELLLLEVDAWEKSKILAKQFNIYIDEDHVQDCLDTYRDWLHQRATCPRCSTVSLQASISKYQCHNCQATWTVTKARFCRSYRLSNPSNKKSPETISQATFR